MKQFFEAVGRPISLVPLFVRYWKSLIQVIVIAVAAALGFWGWEKVNHPVTWGDSINNVFRTLQLLTFQLRTPGDVDFRISWQLNVARFLLPAAALVGSYRLLLGSIRSPARLAMLGLRRGHVIVAPGRGPTGEALLHDLRNSGLRAVAVMADIRAEDRIRIEEYGLAALPGDPFLKATWHQARADRADLIVIANGNDVENLNITVTVAEALRYGRRRRDPMLVMALEDQLLAEQIDFALDNAARGSGLRYRRLSVPGEAARTIFLDPPLSKYKLNRDDPSHIIVLGLGPGARAVLRHALTLAQDAAVAGPRISILASEEELAAERLLQQDTIPAYVAGLRGIACDMSSTLPLSVFETLASENHTPVLACICLPDDAAVSSAIALARHATLLNWPHFPIAVHQQREDRFLSLLARENTMPGHSRLRPFGGLLPPGTLVRLQHQQRDKVPQAVHEHYLELLERQGATDGTRTAWDDLPENYRHANGAFADHIPVKLAAIGCRIVNGTAPPFEFTGDEVDALARIEHRRWSAERLLQGWRLGERNEAQRLHPDLVPFECLTELGQEKDRHTVSSLPRILALAGQSICRD